MKHLILILFLAIAADAQIFGPAPRVRRGTGAPSAGECVASSDVGKVYIRADQGNTNYPLSVCSNNGSGTFGWVQAGAGGSGSGDVLGGGSLTTAGVIPFVSSSGTLGQDTAIVRVSAGILGATTYRSGDGSTTAPAFSFTGETNTGTYRVSARNLGFVVNGSPILGMGDNGGNYLRVVSGSIQFTTNIGAGGDVALARASINNLAITNGSSTNYWGLGAGGIQCLSGDGNSAACDVGTSGARIRNLGAAGTGTFGGVLTSSNLKRGSGSPEGAVTGVVGDIFQRTDGGSGTSAYIKESGTGNTGWVAVAAGGGSGSGATATFGLSDLQVVRTSGTVLTIGGSCSVSAPCNVRFGNTVYSFTGSATATISSGTGTVLFYVLPSGQLTVGYNSAPVPSCSAGCTPVSGVTAFPADSIPLASWTATSGDWDITSAAFDKRAMLAAKPLAAGSGISISESGGVATIAATGGSGGTGYSLMFKSEALWAPANATSYCFGLAGGTYSWAFDCSSSAAYFNGFKLQVPKAGAIKVVSLNAWYGLGVAASAHNITLAVCISTGNGEGTCTNVTTTMQWTATTATYTQVTGLNIPVSVGDRLLMKITTPTWTTSPTDVGITGSIYIE